MELEIGDIIMFVLAGGVGLLLKNRFQNANALKKNDEANKKVDELHEESKRAEALLKEEAEARAEMKENLRKEIKREPTDEELADFINERYTNNRN